MFVEKTQKTYVEDIFVFKIQRALLKYDNYSLNRYLLSFFLAFSILLCTAYFKFNLLFEFLLLFILIHVNK